MTTPGLWNYKIFDTISGDFVCDLEPSKNRMKRKLNGVGDGASVIPPQFANRAQFREATTPWDRTIVKFRNKKVYDAQLITKRGWDYTDKVLKVSHLSIRAVLASRHIWGTNAYSGHLFQDFALDLDDRSLAEMPAWIVWAAIGGPTANFDLPIHIPQGKITFALINSLPKGGGHDRSWPDYKAYYADDVLDEVSSDEGGPFIDFQGDVVNDKLRWNLRSGSIGGVLGGNEPYTWVLDNAEPSLFDVSSVEDGTKKANIAHSIGEGSEHDMLVESASAAPTGVALERDDDYKDIDQRPLLASHARANLVTFNKLTKQWEMSMKAWEYDGIESMPLGSVHHLFHDINHPWEGPDAIPVHVIGDETTDLDDVVLDVQPV
jgi:hypothetical protein